MKHLGKHLKVCIILTTVAATGLAIAGCQGGLRSSVFANGQNQGVDVGDDGTPLDYSKPVYSKEISHLMNKHCASCHQPGGVAPFALNTYEDVSRHAAAIRTSVLNRTMPPPGVDNSGDCQTFTNATWLTEQEIDAITRWTDTGRPHGDTKVKGRAPPKLSDLSGPKTILKMKEPYTPAPPAGSLDDYRCFILDPGITEDTTITAVQVLPDIVAQVHHVIVFKPNSEEAQTKAEAKAGVDGRPGYTCFGSAGVPSSIVGLWAPGASPVEHRDADTGQLLGIPMEKGRKLILQVHYNSQNGIAPDQSSIAVKMNKDAIRTKWMVLVNALMSLEAGQPDVVAETEQGSPWMQAVNIIFERGLADDFINGGGILSALSWELVGIILNQPEARDFRVYAIAPHMHTLGTHLTVEKIATDPAKNSCMGDVPNFDFHWQAGYNYVKPLHVDKTDRLKIRCRFNTSSRTETVSFGEGTEDEMCLAFLLVKE